MARKVGKGAERAVPTTTSPRGHGAIAREDGRKRPDARLCPPYTYLAFSNG